mmetsp:Transcript_27828/g.45668  ORF Transcript_27828/g.45668 Transcript_27828/m.45668 type:complete len:565 (-) Transcript_27828:90-1784(-)
MDDILSWLVDENDRLARAEADRRDKLLADVHRGFDEAKTNITLLLRRKIVCSSEDESISNPPVADRRPPKRKSPLELELEPEPSRKSPPEQLAKRKSEDDEKANESEHEFEYDSNSLGNAPELLPYGRKSPPEEIVGVQENKRGPSKSNRRRNEKRAEKRARCHLKSSNESEESEPESDPESEPESEPTKSSNYESSEDDIQYNARGHVVWIQKWDDIITEGRSQATPIPFREIKLQLPDAITAIMAKNRYTRLQDMEKPIVQNATIESLQETRQLRIQVSEEKTMTSRGSNIIKPFVYGKSDPLPGYTIDQKHQVIVDKLEESFRKMKERTTVKTLTLYIETEDELEAALPGSTFDRTRSIVVPPKTKGHSVPMILELRPSGVPAIGKSAAVNEALLAAKCLGCDFGADTRVIDLGKSEEVRKYYPGFKLKDYETVILTSRGEAILASVARADRRGGSGTGEYYVKKGDILIKTFMAVEGRLVDPYYTFVIGTAAMLMNVLMLVAFTGLTKEANMHTDHINGNTLDNRLENLRPVTLAVNNANRDFVDYRQMLANHTDRSNIG